MAATKSPPVIASGVKCPKCGGPMLDERQTKRTDKSPDYTCANMTCLDKSGKYRTAIWQKDVNGSTPAASAVTGVSAGSVSQPVAAESGKPKMRDAYKSLTEWVLAEIVPIYDKADLGLSPEAAAACVQTLFIQACQSGKVE